MHVVSFVTLKRFRIVHIPGSLVGYEPQFVAIFMIRVDSGSLPITHDFLATMLGTDRPTVSLAAGVLQKKKLIEYTRGAVKIVNRKKLEHSACECYGITQQYNGELGLK